jgi:hypothetical protein
VRSLLPPALSQQRSGHTTYTKFRTDPLVSLLIWKEWSIDIAFVLWLGFFFGSWDI